MTAAKSFSPMGQKVVMFLLLSLAWFAVIRIVWSDWRVDPQYSYGILVPILVIGLLLKRREDAPSPSCPCGLHRAAALVALLGAAILLALVIPLAESNPDWRPLGLAASLAGVCITLTLIYLRGGMPWLRHYFFPICFFLIAVPWPRNFEQSLMGGLMSWNAAATLEILHWFGYEAMRQGNLIVIPQGILGIEEACSGIRSLQSGLMTALFFGEIFRLHAARRVLLLGVSLLAALLGNILRSSFLAVVASRQGLAAVSTWHDTAGLLVLLATVGAVFFFAVRWRRTTTSVSKSELGETAVGAGDLLPLVLASLVLILSFGGSEAWFRVHESGVAGSFDWMLKPRENVPGVSRVNVPSATLKMLFYPEGFSERWITTENHLGQSFYFRWPAGRTSAQAISMHNPEVCLSSIGMKLKEPLSPMNYTDTGVTIPFHSWLFDQQGRPVYVFHAIIEDGRGGVPDSLVAIDDSPRGRLNATLQARRNRGQRLVEVALWNMSGEEEARAALADYLRGAMTISTVASPMNH